MRALSPWSSTFVSASGKVCYDDTAVITIVCGWRFFSFVISDGKLPLGLRSTCFEVRYRLGIMRKKGLRICLARQKGVYYEKSPMIYLQVLRHSSLSRLRQLILTASLVSVVTLKGLCSGQAPSYIHLFSFLLLSYGRAKSSFRQFNTNFPVIISSLCMKSSIVY